MTKDVYPEQTVQAEAFVAQYLEKHTNLNLGVFLRRLCSQRHGWIVEAIASRKFLNHLREGGRI
jgi:hypothetical protein